MRFLVLALILIAQVSAATIADVPASDPLYGAIQKTVDEDYLNLKPGNTFKPTRPVQRDEIALIIDKLNKKIEFNQLNLTQAEMQEVLHMAKNFKQYLAEHELKMTQLMASKDNAKTDISQLSNELSVVKKTQKNNFWLVIGSFVLAGIAVITG